MGFYEGFALLTFALIDFIIAEIIGLIIVKKSLFQKSEVFVFGTMGAGTLIFFISNIFQDYAINLLAPLKEKLFILFILIVAINTFILAKLSLGRRWGFRLVIISLFIIAFIVLTVSIYLYVTTNITFQP